MKRPQSAFLALLASGFSPVYPCHVSPRDMRQHSDRHAAPSIVEFKPNGRFKLVRNADTGSPPRGPRPLTSTPTSIRFIRNMSTAVLAFVSGKSTLTFGGLTVPLTRGHTQIQSPQAICEP